MPLFRRFAVVVSPPAAAATLVAYADLLTRQWSPQAVRLLVPEADHTARRPGSAAERVAAELVEHGLLRPHVVIRAPASKRDGELTHSPMALATGR